MRPLGGTGSLNALRRGEKERDGEEERRGNAGKYGAMHGAVCFSYFVFYIYLRVMRRIPVLVPV